MFDSLPTENIENVSLFLKERRVVMNLTQKEASERSGVNLETLRHFEQTGQISLLNFFKLLSIYRMDRRIMECIKDRSWWTLEQLEKSEKRKRARS